MDDFGQARLADPGLLCVLAKGRLLDNWTNKFPYRWMAPELLKKLPAKATFATDVYSVTMTSLVFFFSYSTGQHIIVNKFRVGDIYG